MSFTDKNDQEQHPQPDNVYNKTNSFPTLIMQKKLYKHRSMPFNPREHILYKVFYSQNGTDKEL